MIISAEQHTELSTQYLFDEFEQYSVAILTARNLKEPTFIGSGFCIECHGEQYLITAAHVFDSEIDGLYIGKKNLRLIEGKGYCTQAPNKNLDIAVIPISNEAIEEIGIKVIQQSKFSHDNNENGFHLIIGYPVSKNKLGKAIHIGNKSINSKCYIINSMLADIDYTTFNKSPMDHIAIDYDKAYSTQTGIYQPPSLRGMSGSPLWVTKDAFDVKNAWLSGFLIEWHSRSKVAFCTRLHHVLGFIEARYA